MISLQQISMLVFGRPSARFRSRARRRAPQRRSGEAGYTLLFAVFLAASMLIMLSVISLKITTQGQREAEEEMIWRGHQYERGIQRYVQKFGRYPSRVEDMVKATSGVRYMREAYKDPMNKEDGTWRFIYVTPAGQLIGSVRYTSLVQMALMDKMASMGGNMNAMGGIPGTAPLNGTSSPFGNSSGFGSPGGFGSSNSGFGSGSSGFGNQGSSTFGQQGNQTNQGSNQNTRQQNQNQSGNQDDSGNNNSTGNPGGNSNGNSSFGGQNPGGGQNGLGGGNSSSFGFSNNGNGQQSGSAFGFSSDQGSGSSPLGQMSVLGGSITGVGSKIEKPSLMVYKRAKKYKEWEFIYNPIEQQQQAAAGIGGGGGAVIGQPAGGLGGSSFGTPGGLSGGGTGGGLGGGLGGGGSSPTNPFSPQPTQPQQPQQPQQNP